MIKASALSLTIDRDRAVRIAAWSMAILLSWLPDILFYELVGNVPSWLVWVKVGLVISFLTLSYVWKDIRVLRNYALVFGVLWLALKVTAWVSRTAWFQNLSKDMEPFSSRHLLFQFLDLIPAVIMILFLLLLLRQWSRFFFARGDSSVDTAPEPWLGIGAGTSVRNFGAIFTLFAVIGTFLLLGLGLVPSFSMVRDALPLLPIILFAALLNSFSEEVLFRSSFLSVSHDVVGKGQSIMMAAIIFGSAHYIGGQPNLLLGALITTYLGWAWGIAMLESRSILLPWAMHFALNAIIFFFNEMGTTLTR